MTRPRRPLTRYELVNGRYRKRDERVRCPRCGRKVHVVRLFGTRGLSYGAHQSCPLSCSPVTGATP